MEDFNQKMASWQSDSESLKRASDLAQRLSGLSKLAISAFQNQLNARKAVELSTLSPARKRWRLAINRVLTNLFHEKIVRRLGLSSDDVTVEDHSGSDEMTEKITSNFLSGSSNSPPSVQVSLPAQISPRPPSASKLSRNSSLTSIPSTASASDQCNAISLPPMNSNNNKQQKKILAPAKSVSTLRSSQGSIKPTIAPSSGLSSTRRTPSNQSRRVSTIVANDSSFKPVNNLSAEVSSAAASISQSNEVILLKEELIQKKDIEIHALQSEILGLKASISSLSIEVLDWKERYFLLEKELDNTQKYAHDVDENRELLHHSRKVMYDHFIDREATFWDEKIALQAEISLLKKQIRGLENNHKTALRTLQDELAHEKFKNEALVKSRKAIFRHSCQRISDLMTLLTKKDFDLKDSRAKQNMELAEHEKKNLETFESLSRHQASAIAETVTHSVLDALQNSGLLRTPQALHLVEDHISNIHSLVHKSSHLQEVSIEEFKKSHENAESLLGLFETKVKFSLENLGENIKSLEKKVVFYNGSSSVLQSPKSQNMPNSFSSSPNRQRSGVFPTRTSSGLSSLNSFRKLSGLSTESPKNEDNEVNFVNLIPSAQLTVRPSDIGVSSSQNIKAEENSNSSEVTNITVLPSLKEPVGFPPDVSSLVNSHSALLSENKCIMEQLKSQLLEVKDICKSTNSNFEVLKGFENFAKEIAALTKLQKQLKSKISKSQKNSTGSSGTGAPIVLTRTNSGTGSFPPSPSMKRMGSSKLSTFRDKEKEDHFSFDSNNSSDKSGQESVEENSLKIDKQESVDLENNTFIGVPEMKSDSSLSVRPRLNLSNNITHLNPKEINLSSSDFPSNELKFLDVSCKCSCIKDEIMILIL